MTRSAVAIRHVPFEDLGLLAPLLRERGYHVDYLDAGVDDLTDGQAADADLLVVLGGPIGVGDLASYPFPPRRDRPARAPAPRPAAHARHLPGSAADRHRTRRAGAAQRRRRDRVRTAGAHRRGLGSPLAAIANTPVLHWHGDRFETPRGAVNLAATDHTPDQAFSLGAHVLALQFHLEVDHTQIERWLIGHCHELASNGIDPRRIRADAATHGPGLADRARTVSSAWLDGVGDPT